MISPKRCAIISTKIHLQKHPLPYFTHNYSLISTSHLSLDQSDTLWIRNILWCAHEFHQPHLPFRFMTAWRFPIEKICLCKQHQFIVWSIAKSAHALKYVRCAYMCHSAFRNTGKWTKRKFKKLLKSEYKSGWWSFNEISSYWRFIE